MSKFYTGIGSRETPDHVLDFMADVAAILASEEWVLRSGGANGADAAFERGCDSIGGEKEIFLPWKGFNNSSSKLFDIPVAAYKIAEQHYHSNWNATKSSIKKLMARNVQQVLGKDLNSPSKFVICWTPDGCETMQQRTKKTGGTGQAISVADFYGIVVYNLFNKINLTTPVEFLQMYSII